MEFFVPIISVMFATFGGYLIGSGRIRSVIISHFAHTGKLPPGLMREVKAKRAEFGL